MNIAIITTWFPAGGGYVSKAYQQILKKEHNVFIYARGGQVMKGHPKWDHPNVTWAPRHYNGIKTRHFIKWLKKNKIDVAFFNEQRYWKPVLEAKKAGVCIGAYIDYYTQETVLAFEIYDFLICNTKRHYSVFNWHPNAYYIPWGTDIEKYKPESNKNDRIPTFIISAGWQPTKKLDRRGSLLALKAFSEVTGECKLKIFSQVQRNEFTNEWLKYLDDERIELKIGTYEPFPYTEGDIYLYPSRLDGIGLTLPEAISSGLAAITTDNPPMNEFVENNNNGLLVKVSKYVSRFDGYYWPESIVKLGDLTKAIQFYTDNLEIVREHKNNSLNFAKQYLDWSQRGEKVSNIFKRYHKNKFKKSHSQLEKVINNIDKIYNPSRIYRIKKVIRDTLINLHV